MHDCARIHEIVQNRNSYTAVLSGITMVGCWGCQICVKRVHPPLKRALRRQEHTGGYDDHVVSGYPAVCLALSLCVYHVNFKLYMS